MSARLVCTLCVLGLTGTALAQSAPAEEPPAPVTATGAPIALVADTDDSDDDGVEDARQASDVPPADTHEIVLEGDQAVQINTLGALRVLRHGKPVSTPLTLAAEELPAPILLQAERPSVGSHSLALMLTRNGSVERRDVHAVELSFLDASNAPLSAATGALSLSHRVTSDPTLPRSYEYAVTSSDPHNVRVQITDSRARGKRVEARLESLSEVDGSVQHVLPLTLVRPDAGLPFRSRFVRLVGDEVDASARGVSEQVLRVALRDRVRLVYETESGTVHQSMRVGRPGDEQGTMAARRAALRVVVLRARPGGPPVIGTDDLSALRIVRDEIDGANEIWLQCQLTFGRPSEVAVEIADPPSSGMIAVADQDGLPARGGAIRLRVDGKPIGPIEIPTGSRPVDTALRIADALKAARFDAVVTVNPRTVFGAASSADIVVRARSGRLAVLAPWPGMPLTTDPQQRISLGAVDLGDGLEEFDNMTAAAGTLEERTLIKTLSDEDPASIDLFIVNRFTHGTRQGEAFIEASSGPIANVVVLDRTGLRFRQTAWTMAHEIGHVLLNQPLHPDNVGADSPSRLMDSDSNRGTVNGPKRLVPDECVRARYEGETLSVPPILEPFDARPSQREAQPVRSGKTRE